MKRKIALILFGVLASALTMMAQTAFTGKVIDANNAEGIPGVVVKEVGKSNGVMTDINGFFTIKVKTPGSIQLSYIGYQTKVIELKAGTNAKLGRIELREDATALGEVVVIGSSLIDIVKDRQTPIAATTLSGKMIEEKIGNLEFPEALKGVPSVYTTSTGGYGDGSFSVRGFDQANVLVLINGQPVNDMEWGGIYWSNWSGLADVASVVQQQRGLGSSKIGVSSVGGTTNIVTKAADRERGGKFKTTVGNNGFVKTTASYDSGLQGDWAFSALLSYWRGDGYMDATAGQGGTYFFSIGYKPSEEHAFNFTITGAPQVHQQDYRETINTYEKYGMRYNSNWGYRDGKVFSFATNFYHKPIANFNWDWNISRNIKLSTVAYGSWGYGGGAGSLGVGHYKYPKDENGQIPVDLIVQANQGGPAIKTLDKKSNKEVIISQVLPWDGSKRGYSSDPKTPWNKSWDGKHIVTTRPGEGTVMRSSMNNHSWYGLLSNLDVKLGNHWTLNTGLDLRTYTGKHYQLINDLLGADAFYDTKNINTAGVFVTKTMPINPLDIYQMTNSPKVFRNYDSNIRWAGLFGQVEYASEHATAFVQGSASNQMYHRAEYFEVHNSDMYTKWTNRWGGNIKGGVNWKINRDNNVFMNAGFFSRQPFFTSFYPYAYTPKANVREDIPNEKITSVEGGYVFNSPYLRANLNAYYTVWGNRYTSFPADYNGERRSARTYIDQKHRGVELEFTAYPINTLDIYGMISYGKWTYGGTADANVYDIQGEPIPDASAKLYLDGVEIGGSPQFQTRLGAKWSFLKGFSINADWYYNDNNFANINATKFSKEGVQNLKMPSYHLFDAGIAYNKSFNKIWLQRLGVRLNVNNLFDSKYIARGYSNIAASDDPAKNWKGINKDNQVEFGYGRTWNISLTLGF